MGDIREDIHSFADDLSLEILEFIAFGDNCIMAVPSAPPEDA